MPSTRDAGAHYDDDYFEGGGRGGYLDYDGEVIARAANARAGVARLARVLPPGRLLEVGSASGWFLAEAARAGWSVAGVEINDAMRARASERLSDGTPMWATLDHVDLDAGSVDAVVMLQVLEHLADPGHALTVVRRLLRPGGTLLLETWDSSSLVARALGARWQQASPPSVLWLFTHKGLGLMLHRGGFGDIAIKRGSKHVALGSVVSLVAERAPVGSSWLRALAGRRGVGQRTVPYGLGDLVVVTAAASDLTS
jgi:SAM-dependent methyltransferase